MNVRPAGVDWISRHPRQKYAYTVRWHELLLRATPDQLALFGFPDPGIPSGREKRSQRLQSATPAWASLRGTRH